MSTPIRDDERQLRRAIRQARLVAALRRRGPAALVGIARMLAARQGMPPNRLRAILAKWDRKGWWDSGVSLEGGWPTEAGLTAFADDDP